VDGGATLTLTNVPGLTGSGVLTKNGAGTLALNSANAYTNGTILDIGILAYNASGALGSRPVGTTPTSTGRIVLGDGTTLTNSISADSVNPSAFLGFLMTGDNTNSTVTTVSGPITFNANALTGGHFVGPTTSGRLNVTGPINLGGFATALIARVGNLRFAGGGTYPEIQVRANTTSLGANNGIATNAVMDLAGNGSPTVPTYFDLNGFNQILAGLKNTVTPANLGVVTNSGAAATLTLDLGGGGPFSFSGNVVGNLAIRLTAGMQVLAGTNSYTGSTTVGGGTLEIVLPTLAAGSSVSIASGATLQLDFGSTNQVAALVLNGVNQPAGVYNSTTSPAFISGSGSLLVSPIATNPITINAVVNGNQYTLSWPSDHIGWRLQAQTNSVSVGLSTNWATVLGSTTTNQISIPINTANGCVFFRLSYP
jgi:autotransporter-associated beta strand protein